MYMHRPTVRLHHGQFDRTTICDTLLRRGELSRTRVGKVTAVFQHPINNSERKTVKAV